MNAVKEQFNLNSILSAIVIGVLIWIGGATTSNNSKLAVVISVQEAYRSDITRVQADIESIKLKQQVFELQLLDFKNMLNRKP